MERLVELELAAKRPDSAPSGATAWRADDRALVYLRPIDQGAPVTLARLVEGLRGGADVLYLVAHGRFLPAEEAEGVRDAKLERVVEAVVEEE